MTASRNIELLIKEHLRGALFSCASNQVSLRGKVRDLIIGDDTIVMINTDRISAFDHVLGTIPLKGAMLAEQTCFWLNRTKHIVENHLIDRPDPQIMVVKKAQPILIEVVVRGYLAGSLMREHPEQRGHTYGLKLDPYLKNYQQLLKPIITPSTKAQAGKHDQPISPKEIIAQKLVREDEWHAIAEIALALFQEGSVMLKNAGLLLVDTKYEFGIINGVIHLIDEIHTCDSSRFFLADDYDEKFPKGLTPIMLDKEFLRQYLLAEGLTPQSDLSSVKLNDDVRIEVGKRYFTLTEKMTGRDFDVPRQLADTRVPQRLATLIC